MCNVKVHISYMFYLKIIRHMFINSKNIYWTYKVDNDLDIKDTAINKTKDKN